MSRILVLGRTGQVASELAAAAWPTALKPVFAGRPEFDMTRPETLEPLLEQEAPAVVINATAYTDVNRAEKEREVAFAVNRDGPARLAALCRRHGLPLLHISSDYVFSGAKPEPYLEEDPPDPLNIYGESKAAGEAAVRAVWSRHIILRTSWVYSAHGSNFVKTMLGLGRERNEVRMVADQWGAPTAAADIAATLIEIAETVAGREDAPWGTYHYTGGGGAITWHELAEHIFEAQEQATGRRPSLIAIATADYQTPARRPANSRLDCSRLERVFGIAGRPWRQGVDRVLSTLLHSEAAVVSACDDR